MTLTAKQSKWSLKSKPDVILIQIFFSSIKALRQFIKYKFIQIDTIDEVLYNFQEPTYKHD